tara:strand:+ start:13865 stop:14323 length:459 start_codon:yes stop_codon:yes gene_type:complete
MSWYKKAQRNLWEMSPRSKEYNDLDINTLDRMAFGFARNDIKTLSPGQLEIKWKDDLDNVIWEQKNSGKSEEEWAKSIDLTEPIDVIFEDGTFKVDDGHHRYYAAQILGLPLNVSIEIKDNPYTYAMKKAISEGKPVPPEILNEWKSYNELV